MFYNISSKNKGDTAEQKLNIWKKIQNQTPKHHSSNIHEKIDKDILTKHKHNTLEKKRVGIFNR